MLAAATFSRAAGVAATSRATSAARPALAAPRNVSAARIGACVREIETSHFFFSRWRAVFSSRTSMLLVKHRYKDELLFALGEESGQKVKQKSSHSPNANAAAAGSLFFFLSLTPPSCRSRLQPLYQLTAPRASATSAEATLDVTKMAPLGDRLLVRPRPAEEKSQGGVILSAGLSGGATLPQQDALVGTVVAVGEDVSLEGLAVGDSVLFSKYSSSDVSLPDGGEVCFVAEKSVLAKLS